MRPGRIACLALFTTLWFALPALAQRRVQVEPPTARPQPQTLAEFLDSLADNALTADPSQLYRVDGKRRIIALGGGWLAALDEQASGRLVNAGTGPGTAGPPGKAFEITQQGPTTRVRLYTQQDSTGRENGAAAAWQFAPGWQLHGQALSLRDADTGIRRREADAGLRFGSDALWVEGLLRRAALEDSRTTTLLADPRPHANYAGVQLQWQPEAVPGLGLYALTQHALSSHTAPGEERLADPRTEIGADYKLASPALPGARIYWHEAPQLGLLASDGLEERSTYRRTLGAEMDDGSPEGKIYTQLRQRSLSDSRNALLVAGWRHALQPAPRWGAQTFIEQAQPVAGPSAIRSTTLGLRVTHGAHPHHTLLAETETVHSSVKDSVYLGLKYTHRLTENTLAAWRFSVVDTRPRDPPGVPVTETKASVGWAWREPTQQRFNTLWRYSWLGRQAQASDPLAPGAADRKSHIVFSHFGWQPLPATLLTLRASRRWEFDEAVQSGALRTTELVIARTTQELAGRWSVSVHAATRRDSLEATQTGLGAELGLRLSNSVALALGYNLRGIDDSELAIDDRLGKGFTLRLRFSIEAALARWLNPSMEAVRAAGGGAP